MSKHLSIDEITYKDWHRDENGKLKLDWTGTRKMKKKYPDTERRTYSEKEKKGLLEAIGRFKSYHKARKWYADNGFGELKESSWDIILRVWKQYGRDGVEYLVENHSVSDVKREMRKRADAMKTPRILR